MQSKNVVFDGIARAIADTAGAIDGVRREADTVINSQLQRFAAEHDLVPREEFEAVREMLMQALDRIDQLEAKLGGETPEKKT